MWKDGVAVSGISGFDCRVIPRRKTDDADDAIRQMMLMTGFEGDDVDDDDGW